MNLLRNFLEYLDVENFSEAFAEYGFFGLIKFAIKGVFSSRKRADFNFNKGGSIYSIENRDYTKNEKELIQTSSAIREFREEIVKIDEGKKKTKIIKKEIIYK